MVTVTTSTLDQNVAQAGFGGNGVGGGIADLLSATTTVSGSFVILNQANGRSGAGLGGGAYNDATSSLALSYCAVALNQATGSPGIGGGVYTVGTFTESATIIAGNYASTSGNNIGP